MKLRDYLSENSITQAKFAETVTGILRSRYGLDTSLPQQAVSKAAKGYLPKRREVVQAIYEATDGRVAPNDFFDLPTLNPRQDKAA